MNGSSDDSLARARLALDQRDRIAFRDHANLIQDIHKRGAMTHDVVFDALGVTVRSSMVP